MKNLKTSFIAILLVLVSFPLLGQKIGVVDTNYILSKLPQYKDAEARLNKHVETWQKEIEEEQAELDNKKKAFESEKILLVGNQLKQRESDISENEKKIKDIILKKFGTNGEINQLRANLVKPFQDQIWNAIKTMSEKNVLGVVLDKSNNISVIFLDKKYDYTDKVLEILLKSSVSNDKDSKNNKK